MKFNCKELAEYSNGEAIIEGRLHHKRVTSGFSQSGFKEKWFKLRANILFYFSTTETGKAYDKKVSVSQSLADLLSNATEHRLENLAKVWQRKYGTEYYYFPVGAFVLENATVQYEMNVEAPFAFSIIFQDDLEKKHLFSGRTEECINQWVNFLKQASYEFWRSQLILLQTQICMLTGKDPLLMYPRNEGSTTFSDDPNAIQNQKLKKSPVPSFRSYVTHEEEKRSAKPNQVPNESLLNLTNEKLVNGINLIDSEIKNVQIDPPPAPPKRPARANRLKANNSSPNLIEL